MKNRGVVLQHEEWLAVLTERESYYREVVEKLGNQIIQRKASQAGVLLSTPGS